MVRREIKMKVNHFPGIDWKNRRVETVGKEFEFEVYANNNRAAFNKTKKIIRRTDGFDISTLRVRE